VLLYQVIYPELDVSQEAIFDSDGVQWGGPGKQGMDAPAPIDSWNAWIKAYQKQSREDYTKIPLYVNDYYQKAKMFSRPPTEKELDFTLILTNHNINIDWTPTKEIEKEVKDKPFTWSCSALNAFESCPYSFAEERIYKRVKRAYSQEANWGIEVHDLIARYLNAGSIINIDPIIAKHEPYLRAILSCPKDKLFVEKQFAIT